MVGVVLRELPEEQVSVPGAAELEFDPPEAELDGQVATVATEETTRVPFWVTPRAAWSFSKAVVVAEPKGAEVGIEYGEPPDRAR